VTKSQPSSPILRTKLYRPPVTDDYVSRPTIERSLEASINKPLTLVVAPAGYGKTTLVSRWLSEFDSQYAWLSLDESESDLRLFLSYVLEALQTIDASFGAEFKGIIEAESLPAPDTLAIYLCNDLDSLDKRAVLVLDDYHRIRSPDVNQLLDALLLHPSRNLHLLLVTRRDPTIAIQTLRAHNMVGEVRMRELQFTSSETHELVQRSNIGSIRTSTIDELHKSTEGWPAGIRLALLASRHKQDPQEYLSNFGSRNLRVKNYIVDDVIGELPEHIQSGLMYTALLGSFSAPLCDACLSDNGRTGGEGEQFMEVLRQSGLPIVFLDGEHDWLRYHHLFGEMLRQRLEESRDRAFVRDIHKRAATWYAQNRYIEDGITHAIAAGDNEFAVGLVGQFRHEQMANDDWPRMERWLKLFDPAVIRENLELMLLECWLDLSYRYELASLFERIDIAQALLEQLDEGEERDQLSMEIDVLQSPFTYVYMDSGRGRQLTEPAISRMSPDREYIRSIALMYCAGAYQLDGELSKAEDLVQKHLGSRDFSNPNSTARLLQALCFMYWASADVSKLEVAAKRLLELSLEHKLSWSISFGHYFVGVVAYERDCLDEAIAHLAEVVDRPHHFPIQNVTHCAYVLCLAYEAKGQSNMATRVATRAAELSLERANSQFITTTEAFAAELASRRSQTVDVERWVESATPTPETLLHRFFHPEVAWVKAVVTQNLPDHQAKAGEVIDSLLEVMARSHHRRLHIDVLALQALIANRAGNPQRAIEYLSEAVQIGQPGQLVRPIADLGPELVPVLNKITLDDEGLKCIGSIIAGMQGNEATVGGNDGGARFLPEALSDRETEILELLAKGLSNREIGEKLYISPGTVKRHAHNIYGKLAVSGRREAVSKATALGILG
jgi:LuxR family maltose regulon positive regulatory protein